MGGLFIASFRLGLDVYQGKQGVQAARCAKAGLLRADEETETALPTGSCLGICLPKRAPFLSVHGGTNPFGIVQDRETAPPFLRGQRNSASTRGHARGWQPATNVTFPHSPSWEIQSSPPLEVLSDESPSSLRWRLPGHPAYRVGEG